jgi:CubicO group peptidase (beta-lactamase class C family)
MTPEHWNAAAAIAEQITAGWRESGSPGGAVVLFDRAGIHAMLAGGLANIEHGIPFTAETPTRLASISKHLLAATLLRAEVPLDAPLSTWLDGLPEAFANLPLARALDMSAALPDMMEVLWQQGIPYSAGIAATEVMQALRRLRATCAVPGTEMAYSNTGWRLGQQVVAAHRGMPYPQSLHELLLAPLGLSLAFPEDATVPVPGLATGYWRDGAQWRRGRYGMHFSASGGLAGSAATLARWAAALLAGTAPLQGMLRRLSAPRHYADGGPSHYGLGLVHLRLGGTELLGHGGSLPGYRNSLLMAPGAGVGVVLLSNRDEDVLWPALRIMAALCGEALPEPPAAPPTGLYATAAGPFWAQFQAPVDGPATIEYMGAQERLVAGPDGQLRSLPSTLEVSLRPSGDGALEGRIGGVHRRLLPVPPGLPLDPRLVGQWRDDVFGAELLVRADGTARFPWAGGTGAETLLTALPGARAIATLSHQMWRHRPCLWLDADGALCLASHRARVLRFLPVPGSSDEGSP